MPGRKRGLCKKLSEFHARAVQLRQDISDALPAQYRDGQNAKWDQSRLWNYVEEAGVRLEDAVRELWQYTFDRLERSQSASAEKASEDTEQDDNRIAVAGVAAEE